MENINTQSLTPFLHSSIFCMHFHSVMHSQIHKQKTNQMTAQKKEFATDIIFFNVHPSSLNLPFIAQKEFSVSVFWLMMRIFHIFPCSFSCALKLAWNGWYWIWFLFLLSPCAVVDPLKVRHISILFLCFFVCFNGRWLNNNNKNSMNDSQYCKVDELKVLTHYLSLHLLSYLILINKQIHIWFFCNFCNIISPIAP